MTVQRSNDFPQFIWIFPFFFLNFHWLTTETKTIIHSRPMSWYKMKRNKKIPHSFSQPLPTFWIPPVDHQKEIRGHVYSSLYNGWLWLPIFDGSHSHLEMAGSYSMVVDFRLVYGCDNPSDVRDAYQLLLFFIMRQLLNKTMIFILF